MKNIRLLRTFSNTVGISPFSSLPSRASHLDDSSFMVMHLLRYIGDI